MTDDVNEKLEIAKQQGEAELIFAVQDAEGNKHYIFGDDFANYVIGDMLQKLQLVEAETETPQ